MHKHVHSWPHFPYGSGTLDASAAGSSHLDANLEPNITADNKLALAIDDIDLGTISYCVFVARVIFVFFFVPWRKLVNYLLANR